MTLADLIGDVRKLVDDNEVEYRWPDADICKYLADAIVRLNNSRPESLYINGRLTEIVFPDGYGTFVLPEEYSRWHVGFCYYAAARCLEEDSADTVNQQLAADFMAKAEARFAA